jgi:hypothetical protein
MSKKLTDILNTMLVYLLSFLKKRKSDASIIKNSVVKSSKQLEVVDILKMLDDVNKIGSGSSLVPVIIVHTVLSIIRPYVWNDVVIKPLKEHTAPDNHSSSYGCVRFICIIDKNELFILKQKYLITTKSIQLTYIKITIQWIKSTIARLLLIIN